MPNYYELTAFTSLDDADLIPAIDTSDTVQSANGSTRKITAANVKTYMSDSPALVTPALGTPSSGSLGSCTDYEGTAVISTGEAGGTKFLREDGDGTCSWQVPAGGGGGASVLPISGTFDGGGSALTVGTKVYVHVPYSGTISKVTMLADVSGSVVVDVWKDTYANYPPTVADTIAAAAKPTISSAVKSQDGTLTGWTTSVTAGDIIGFNVDSVTTIAWLIVQLEITL